MRMMNGSIVRRSLAVAVLATVVNANVNAGTSSDAVTISLSGSTAMRSFTTSPTFTSLTPGRTVSLGSGYTFNAAQVDTGNGVFPAVQLGANANDTLPPPNGLVNANYRAYRVEWHEQGSVEGILELANDQIGTVGSVSLSNRNPTVGNPIWINGTLGGSLTAPGTNAGGFAIASTNYNTYNDFNLDGSHKFGGQNRVQLAISDVKATQGFSRTGTAAWNRTPGQAGYGKGNTALNLAGANDIVGLGTGGVRRALNDESVLNMSTDKIDPATGANYTSGAWNNAGIDNLQNTTVAITATTFAANPGTGLTKLNRTDAQFLQATGRLANGADFNVVTRDVNSGTLNVAALNVGLDPSYAVGENDAGNGNAGDALGAQINIGSGITFSGKTAGGGQLRPTVQNSRMAVGHLSIADIRSGNAAGTAANANAGARPLRALAYRDDANDTSDGSNGSIAAGFVDPTNGEFVKVSFDSVTDGTYVIYQNETYVTVRTPTAEAYGVDAIKGDNASKDVAEFRDNITASAAQYPNNSSFLNPANGLISNGFVPTQYMKVRKDQDGLNQSVTNPSFDAGNFGTIKAQAQGAFVVADAANVTTGTGSTYGAVIAANGGIAITGSNFLFGDFDNDGDRDFADVKIAAAAQDKLLASGNGVNYVTGTGATNAQAVAGLTGALASMNGYDNTTGAKKGDLIVKGDFNSDGKFDGKDLYLLARGASLAANTSTDQLTGDFGTSVRTGVLRKNAALDFMQTNATAQQKLDAAANLTNDPTGSNAFNKLDVNRDGMVDRKDASIVDKFVNGNITSLDQQLSATIAVDGSINAALAQKLISLVDAELDDNLVISAVLASGTSDFKLIRDGVGAGLSSGDSDFNGAVNFDDLLKLAQNYQQSGIDQWSDGDFDLNGLVDFDDLLALAQNYGVGTVMGNEMSQHFAADWALAQSMVPEPTSIAAIGILGLAARRRRNG